MRYTRIQKVVKTFCDDSVNDVNIIKQILQTIHDKNLFCSFIFNIDSYTTSSHSKVQVLSVMDDYFSFRSFRGKATMTDSVKYDDLVEIKLETEIPKIIDNDDKDNRWMLLDLDEEEE